MVGGADHASIHMPPFSEHHLTDIRRPPTDPLSCNIFKSMVGLPLWWTRCGHFVKMVHNGVEYGIKPI